jgi:hypothetical protein
MLIDGDAVVNLMPYSVFKKLGQEDDKLMKTNMTLNGVGDNSMEARGVVSWSSPLGANLLLPHSSSSRCKVTIVLFLAVIEFTPIVAFPLLCTNFLFNRSMLRLR